jgi:DNA-binding response OmpR family regulator
MQDWQTRLNERKQQFLIKTKDKIAEVITSLDQLVGSPTDRSALTRVNKHFHQLAGAGGIYEMTEFCEISIAAEELCTRLLMNDSPVGSMEQAKLRAFCDGMLSEIETIQKNAAADAGRFPAPVAHPAANIDVLLADHDAERLASWHRLFEDSKLAVRGVKTASASRGAMMIRLPDVIIINTPLSDSPFGFEILHQLRQMPGGGRTVVILLTKDISFKEKIDAIKCGADSVIESDISPVDLIAKLEELVASKVQRKYKILSVEDDLEQAWFIKSTLESVGYNVMHIADPINFEDALSSFAPDLVLLDIMLGEISGHDLARFVRHHEQFSRLPIIFLTTENQMNMHLESARVGGDEHLLKPIAPQLLVAAIAGRLERA